MLLGTAIVASANVVWPLPHTRPGLTTPARAWVSPGGLLLPEIPRDVWEQGLGVGLTLLSMLLLAGRLVGEELLLRNSPLHPLQASQPWVNRIQPLKLLAIGMCCKSPSGASSKVALQSLFAVNVCKAMLCCRGKGGVIRAVQLCK